jgi:hypothetical protein
MRRVLQALLLMTLLVVAILAKTFDSLIAAPSSAPTVIGSATLHFEGRVTLLNEESSILTVSGTAQLTNSTVPLPSQLQTMALVPFRRTSNGTLQLARQGQMRIRINRADMTSVTLIGNLANLSAILNSQADGHWVIVDGDVDVQSSDDGGWDDFETEIALTDFVPPMDRTQIMATVYLDWTQFPITQTPDVPRTEAPTSAPTIAAPGFYVLLCLKW